MKIYKFEIDFKVGHIEFLFTANNPISFDNSWRYNRRDLTENQERFFKIVCGIFAKDYFENGVRYRFSEQNIFNSNW